MKDEGRNEDFERIARPVQISTGIWTIYTRLEMKERMKKRQKQEKADKKHGEQMKDNETVILLKEKKKVQKRKDLLTIGT